MSETSLGEMLAAEYTKLETTTVKILNAGDFGKSHAALKEELERVRSATVVAVFDELKHFIDASKAMGWSPETILSELGSCRKSIEFMINDVVIVERHNL